MDLHIDADLADIPRQFERDDASGEVTAFNDELRVMAIGADEAEASRNFDAAVVALAE